MKKVFAAVGAALMVALFLPAPAMASTVSTATSTSSYSPPSGNKNDFAQWAREMKNRAYASRTSGKVVKKRAQLVAPKVLSESQLNARLALTNQAVLMSGPNRVSIPSVANVPEGASVKSRVAGAAGKLGSAVGVAVGVDMVYNAGTQFTAGMFGVESHGLACDIGKLISGKDQGCALGANFGYEPNSDFELTTPGFYGGISSGVFEQSEYNFAGGTVSFTIDDASAVYGSNTGTLRVTETYSGGQCGGTAYYPYQITLQLLSEVNGNFVNARVNGSNSVFATINHNPCAKDNPTPASTFSIPYVFTTSTNGLSYVSISVSKLATPIAHQPFPSVSANSLSTLIYFPVGHVSRPLSPAENPVRWWQTEGKCETSQGGTYIERVASAEFYETDEQWPDFPMVECLKAQNLTEYKVYQYTEGELPQLMYEWQIDDETKQWLQDYPECVNGSCTLELERYDTQSRTWLQCFDDPALCAQWFSDPLKAELYRCTYNQQVQDLSDCNMYSKLFDFKDKSMLADPETGQTADESVIVPPKTPDSNAITGITNTQSNNCPPPFEWLSLFNPWWYYQGIKCAVTEVFVPSLDRSPFEPALASFQQGRFGQIVYSFQDQMELLDTGVPRCKGPGGTITLLGVESEMYPLDSCSGWAAEYAPKINGFLTFIAGFMTAGILVNILMSSFGFNARGGQS